MILESRNPVTITLLEKFKQLKIFEQSRFDVPVWNVEASKSSSGSYRYLTHNDRQGRWKERQDTKYKN